MNVQILRVNGTTENHEVPPQTAIRAIERLIGADCLDTVNLRDGRVMLVDDQGHPRALPVNPSGTALYHGVCRPGTTHPIRGDVAIVRDADFA